MVVALDSCQQKKYSSATPQMLWLVTHDCSSPHLNLHAAAATGGATQEDQLACEPIVDELLSVGSSSHFA